MPSLPLILGASLAGYIGVNSAGYVVSKAAVNNENAVVIPPYGAISVNIPSYKEEPEILERSFQSLVQQNIVQQFPKSFEYVYIGVKDDPKLALDVVKKYTDNIVLAPKRGKLLGRDMGIKASKGDVIVSVDSDSVYGPNWLNMMLKPYTKTAQVVGTTATTDKGRSEPFAYLAKSMYYSHLILGRGSTFWKQSYYDVGGFDLSNDYTSYSPENLERLWREEEWDFRKSLDQLGRVVFVDAPMHHVYNCYDITCTGMDEATGRGLRRDLRRGKRA